jgi:hypothetical protein
MAEWGGIISTILGGASGLAENLFGVSWEEEAKKKDAALGPAPTFEMPQSQLDYEKLLNARKRQEMPGHSDALAQADIQRSLQAAGAARVAGSPYGAQAGLGLAEGNRRRQLRRLGIEQEAYTSMAEDASTQAAMQRAPFEQMQFEYNEWLPWQIAKNEIASIRGTGQQQLISGLDNAAAYGIQGAQLWSQNQQPQTGGSPYQLPPNTPMGGYNWTYNPNS